MQKAKVTRPAKALGQHRGEDTKRKFTHSKSGATLIECDMTNAKMDGAIISPDTKFDGTEWWFAIGWAMSDIECQFPAYRSQFVFGVMAPVDCRHKGATAFSA